MTSLCVSTLKQLSVTIGGLQIGWSVLSLILQKWPVAVLTKSGPRECGLEQRSAALCWVSLDRTRRLSLEYTISPRRLLIGCRGSLDDDGVLLVSAVILEESFDLLLSFFAG